MPIGSWRILLQPKLKDRLQREQRTYSGSNGCGAGVDGLVVADDCTDAEADDLALSREVEIEAESLDRWAAWVWSCRRLILRQSWIWKTPRCGERYEICRLH